MARALVTGGAGFIGSHVADRLLARGYEVEVVDDLSSGKRENVSPKAKLHVLDIRTDEAAALVRDGRFDVVAHLAAQIDVRKSVANPLHDTSVNILGTVNLLEAVRALPAAHRPRFVFSSTGGALYGDFTPPPSPEDSVKEPESPYAISKLSVEYHLAYYARVHKLDTVAMRFGNVYGPRQDPHGEAGVVAIFCGRILDGQPLTVFGDGEQTRDYVYVEDVADAMILGATSSKIPAPGRLDARAFNVGTGVGTSVLRLADILRQTAGANAPIQFAPARPGELQHSVLDIRKPKEILGWQPRVTIEDGLARTYAWFAAQHAGARKSLSPA